MPTLPLSLPDSSCKLPPELWAQVLTLLEPNPDLGTQAWLAAQTIFWQLPLVCRTFRQIFMQHKIGRHICLQKLPRVYSALPTLLAWLEAKSDVIETLHTPQWWSCHTEYLVALSPLLALTSLTGGISNNASLEVVARFRTLQSCKLTSQGHNRPLDLAPFLRLERLTDLHLASGEYVNLAANQLTYCALSHAVLSVVAGCSFCNSLIGLAMVNSRLRTSDSKGLLACTALQGLHIGDNCIIHAADPKDILQNQGFPIIPLQMSCLAALRVVTFEACNNMSSAGMVGICKLPHINHFNLAFPARFEAGVEFEHLTKVTELSIRTTRSFGCLRLGFDWSALTALRCLHIQARFCADEQLLGISQLQHLQQVSLEDGSYAVDVRSKALLAQLMLFLGPDKLIT
ncbi:hypothetical protein ABBQ38_006079 [Trebouxia sp. C0009 RCD-2024]